MCSCVRTLKHSMFGMHRAEAWLTSGLRAACRGLPGGVGTGIGVPTTLGGVSAHKPIRITTDKLVLLQINNNINTWHYNCVKMRDVSMVCMYGMYV